MNVSGNFIVLFQNNNELRPAGGFIGSFAEIELDKGQLKNIYFDTNIYKRDNAYAEEHKIIPPKSFQILFNAPYWTMRDANWAADFRQAAQQVSWFYDQEGGDEVDGVIALDTTIFEKMLEITGPIPMPEYDTTITSQNFLDTIQYKVEKEYFASPENRVINEPKTILKDLLEKMLPKLAQAPKMQLLNTVLEALGQKHLVLQFNDPVLENIALRQNWGGAISETQGDYLYVLNSTINVGDDPKVNNGGGKTNFSVDEKVTYKIIENEGKLIANLSIIRTHRGNWDWPDGQNNNFVRIFAPNDSELLSASLDGKDITSEIYTFKEAGKISFATWDKTLPQTSKVLNITYQLPFIDSSNYHLVIQKQPGALANDIQVIYKDRVLYDDKLNNDLDISLR